jgi:hypothetical protein
MKRQEAAVKVILIAAAAIAAALATGCQIDSRKSGDAENVKIATPFGDMSVKTNGAVATGGTGIDLYPGAQLEKKEGKDDSAADVNLSFGKFALRVKAVSYETSDSSDKVIAFYKTHLTKFGPAIECSHNRPVGQPEHTPDGLTCDNDHENHITVTDDIHGKIELKTGSKQHQHIVAIDPQGAGTKIGLVALDLPGDFTTDDSGSGKSERKQ